MGWCQDPSRPPTFLNKKCLGSDGAGQQKIILCYTPLAIPPPSPPPHSAPPPSAESPSRPPTPRSRPTHPQSVASSAQHLLALRPPLRTDSSTDARDAPHRLRHRRTHRFRHTSMLIDLLRSKCCCHRSSCCASSGAQAPPTRFAVPPQATRTPALRPFPRRPSAVPIPPTVYFGSADRKADASADPTTSVLHRGKGGMGGLPAPIRPPWTLPDPGTVGPKTGGVRGRPGGR